jgi:hypothetical protein
VRDQLILKLLDQLEQLGQTAQSLKQFLTSNGHQAHFGVLHGKFYTLVPLDIPASSASETEGTSVLRDFNTR